MLEGERETPLPWSNVIANPGFGTIVTERGAAHTWCENSRENRLTPFANDPITDPTAEALFLRDEDDGVVWAATPGALRRTARSPTLVGAPLGRRDAASSASPTASSKSSPCSSRWRSPSSCPSSR